MINVLHINSYYIGTRLHRIMINHLDSFDVKNQVFVPTSRKGYSYKDEKEYVLISRCFNRFDRFFYFHKQNKIFSSLTKNIDVKKYDIVHAYTVFADGYSAFRLNKKYGTKYVVAVRDTDLNVFFKYFIHLRPLGINILKNATHIYFLSKPYLEELLNKYIPESLHEDIRNKSRLIPNGIDDFWHNNSASDIKNLSSNRNINIICVGRINRRKNVVAIQKAIKKLNNRGFVFSLLVIGKDENKWLLRKIKKDINTQYFQPVPKEELIDYYKRCDLFVLPSLTETFGLVYAEALSQGLPIIYSKGQGFDEQFPNGFVGYAVNPKSIDSIVEGIENVLKNYDVLAEHTVKCSKVFFWSDICKKYYYDYCEMMNSDNKMRGNNEGTNR